MKGLVGNPGNIDAAINQIKNYYKKWNRGLKPPQKNLFTSWPSAPDPAGISRISIRSTLRQIISISPPEAEYLSETPTPPFRLIVSEI